MDNPYYEYDNVCPACYRWVSSVGAHECVTPTQHGYSCPKCGEYIHGDALAEHDCSGHIYPLNTTHATLEDVFILLREIDAKLDFLLSK